MSICPQIRRIAVLGAGVMGAQIAAHLANAHYPVYLFDLETKDNPNHIVQEALQRLAKLKPAPLVDAQHAALIMPCNYGQDLAKLAECDLIIEAIAEKIDYKRELYQKIAPHIRPDALLASNTSGLSIDELAAAMPVHLRPHFCGVHFFNPPRYMELVELIACQDSEPEILDLLETFLTTALGKGVIRAKNTPNFIANRIGVFALLAAVIHAERFGIAINVVDELTGKALKRPKSATFRTADVVGLDTFAHVLQTKTNRLHNDPWHTHYQLPPIAAALIAKGALGQKSGAGFYKKEGKNILHFDLASGDYLAPTQQADAAVLAILKEKNAALRLQQLRSSTQPQAQFLWAVLRDTFHYAAYHLADIADNVRDVDLAMRWGFGWEEGIFETWQQADWQATAAAIAEDIAAGKTLANAPLPAWVQDGRTGVYRAEGAFSPASGSYEKPRNLPVYAKQLARPLAKGEQAAQIGDTVWETDTIRAFVHEQQSDILVVSFKTKMHTCSHELLKDLQDIILTAENAYRGLVIWQNGIPFSAGADLASVAEKVQGGDLAVAEDFVRDFQQTSMRIRFSSIPVVAAVQGMALGGGCEFLLHCDHVVAALESYIGLVEVGVGLLPGGGGCKEFARRAAEKAPNASLLVNHLQDYFSTIALAKVSSNAFEAKALGYLRDSDSIIFNPHELLYAALSQAKALADSGYRPPLDTPFPVAGADGIATLQLQIFNLREGQHISAYDAEIATRIATVLCGGDVAKGSLVNQAWLIELERSEFMQLVKNPHTHARITHMLTTGKPLRN